MTQTSNVKNMIEKSAESLYSSGSQRRWLWAAHPDVAESLETQQLTVNQAVDVVNARQGLLTHYSIHDYMNSPSSVTSFMPKKASFADMKNTYHNIHTGIERIGREGVYGIPGVHSFIDKAKASIGLKPKSLIPEQYMLPVGIGLGMAGASAVRTLGGMFNPRGLVKGVSKDMIREYIQAENDYYKQQGEE